jgi:hypothetical protein
LDYSCKGLPDPAAYIIDGQKITFGQTELTAFMSLAMLQEALHFILKKIVLFLQAIPFLPEVSEEQTCPEVIFKHL